MDGLFKKTMSYLNSEGVVQDEFVGKIVEVASIKLKILRKIAEGESNGNPKFLCCYLQAHDFSLFEVITDRGRMQYSDRATLSSL